MKKPWTTSGGIFETNDISVKLQEIEKTLLDQNFWKDKVKVKKTVKEKMNKADPVLAAIIRGLSLRIGDANALAEKHWLELSVYKSLGK